MREKIENISIAALFFWVALCSFFDFGYIAAGLFLLLLLAAASRSSRASFVILLGLLFLPLDSINLPSAYLIASALILLINRHKIFAFKNIMIINRVVLVYFIFLLLRFISVIFVKDQELFSSYFSISAIVFINILIVMILMDSKEDVAFSARWLGYLGVIASILGFLYYSFHDIAYINQLGILGGLKEVGTIENNMDWVRWIPIGVEPNMWAIGLLLPLGYWLHIVSSKFSVFSVICLIINLLGIFGTYSRSTFLVAGLMILLTLLQSKPRYFFISIVLLILLIVGLNKFFPIYVERIMSIQDNLYQYGGTGRFGLWKEAIENFSQNPLFGVGTGQTSLFSMSSRESHNLYLQTLGENGIFTFLVLLLIIIRPIVDAWKYRKAFFFFIALMGYSINLFTISKYDFRLFLYVVIMLYTYIKSSNNYSQSHT